MNLQVCIMTPDEIFWNEQAEEIILPIRVKWVF
jgi:F0F1-type ATP synthase epsilon subunit